MKFLIVFVMAVVVVITYPVKIIIQESDANAAKINIPRFEHQILPEIIEKKNLGHNIVVFGSVVIGLFEVCHLIYRAFWHAGVPDEFENGGGIQIFAQKLTQLLKPHILPL